MSTSVTDANDFKYTNYVYIEKILTLSYNVYDNLAERGIRRICSQHLSTKKSKESGRLAKFSHDDVKETIKK